MNVVPVPNTVKTPQFKSGFQSEMAAEIQVNNCSFFPGVGSIPSLQSHLLPSAIISEATLLNLKSVTHFMHNNWFTQVTFMAVASNQDLYVWANRHRKHYWFSSLIKHFFQWAQFMQIFQGLLHTCQVEWCIAAKGSPPPSGRAFLPLNVSSEGKLLKSQFTSSIDNCRVSDNKMQQCKDWW